MQLDLNNKPTARAALELATWHHAGVRRKYTGEPYIQHPIRVAEKLLSYGFVDQDVLAAALLHDCIEDENVGGECMKAAVIQRDCGAKVARWVEALTGPPHSAGNRARRKQIYNERLKRAPLQVKAIKCADIADNLKGIAEHDPNFAEQYLAEKEEQLRHLIDGADGSGIWDHAREVLSLERNILAYSRLERGLAMEAERKADEALIASIIAEEERSVFADLALF